MHTNAFECLIITVVANKNRNAQKKATSVCLHSNPHPVRSVDILKNILSEVACVLYVGMPLWHVWNCTRFLHMGANGIWFGKVLGLEKHWRYSCFPDCSCWLIQRFFSVYQLFSVGQRQATNCSLAEKNLFWSSKPGVIIRFHCCLDWQSAGDFAILWTCAVSGQAQELDK